MTLPDYYAVLGVSRGADTEQIRAEYLARARELHPDRADASDPDALHRANQSMARLNEAWDVLSDPFRRQAYDTATTTSRPDVVQRAARSAGSWVGSLVAEYRRGKKGT